MLLILSLQGPLSKMSPKQNQIIVDDQIINQAKDNLMLEHQKNKLPD